ncbi:MAG TPA: hypothetical protein VHC69_10335 [Polyangiaceae bacterium]|nr:hypothetical protein [Polyangiaceae bacterium]
MSTSSAPDASKRHVSELPDPRQRFLARVVDHTLTERWRTADDFLRNFPPQVIVSSLARADDLRVRLLVAATGTHEKIALKKSIPSAVEDLELALAEQTTTPSAILNLYSADDKVRYLDARKLWAFAIEDEFYKSASRPDSGQTEQATKRLTFIVECALSEGVLTLKDVADAVTFEEIAAALPAAEAREVVKFALGIAREGNPLTEERFLSVVPLPTLLSHLPLERTFQRVVIARIAEPNGLVEGGAAPVESPPTAEPAAAPPPSTNGTSSHASAEAPAAAPVAPSESQASVPDEDEVRRGVIDRLRSIDRLPPSSTDLSTPILLSIDSMYAELWSLNDDDEREACIRESFPNETLLRTAMLALIEQLDPSVDTRDPIIRDADVSGLMKIVLFEERRRRDGQSQSRRGSSPAPSRGRRTVPPPLPRTNTPPPLPGEGRAGPPPLPLDASKRDN